MHSDFLKPYDHLQEKDVYSSWEKSGYFSPEKLQTLKSKSPKKPSSIGNWKLEIDNFCIVMPPANANGSLHVGHAVMVAVEDLMVRYWRMRGKKTLWLPGADHAGFETQVVFEKKLEKEGTSRFEILQKEHGRQELYKRIWDFTQENKSHMEHQVRQLGASCDWTRETFTLDPAVVSTVYDTFKKLYDDGLVYRATRIVNWCTKHQTSLSDLEVAWEQRTDKLYLVQYKRADGHGHITVATTRPETIPGDVAIAVHPDDKRFASWVGMQVINPITGNAMPVIADKAVDKDFGTGALKITPAHDPVDFEVGQRHKLEAIKTIDFNGRFNMLAGPFAGMKVAEAREEAVKILEKNGALERMEEYTHQVGVCYKCKNTIEPMILPQWFIDLTSPAAKKKIVQPAINAVKKGTIKIFPAFQEKIFFHWMNNIRDWNISRQIVWGIPIPAWFRKTKAGIISNDQFPISNKDAKEEVYIGKEKPKGDGWIQETDVFDTWFSSGQWPFATLLAQDAAHSKFETQNSKLKRSDFKEFYPTSVMETGYDILFFWVARMIMLGLYRTGTVPFKTVYLHGLVRDKDKQKMSKSKGNVVDPLGVVEQYGADALRMALIVGNSAGQDVAYDEDKVRGYRNFSNKLWNIARFVISHAEKERDVEKVTLTPEDKKLLLQCAVVKKKVAVNIEKYRFSQAAEEAYHYVWHTFADKIIESKKEILNKEAPSITDVKKQVSARRALYELLVQSISMLHPFMPFVTEGIYQRLPAKDKDFLMIEEW